MDYNQLYKKLANQGIDYSMRAKVNHKNGTVTFDWLGCIEPIEFPFVKSQEYQELCDALGCELSDHRGIEYKAGEGDTIVLYPKTLKKGNYEVIWTSTKGTVVRIDGEPVELTLKNVPHYYKGCAEHFDRLIDIYQGNLLYAGGDAVYMLTPDGEIGFVTDYPENCESNRFTVNVDGDTLVTKVYVYYDNDHHHGGWETYKEDLRNVLTMIKRAA